MSNKNFINLQNFNYTKLEEEIKEQEKNRTLNYFKKSIKPKKSLKNKFLAWGLGVSIFLGAVAGTGAIINDQTNGNGAYNREIEKKFEMVDNTLNKAMEDTFYAELENSKINGIYFEEPVDDTVNLKIFYEGLYQEVSQKALLQTFAEFEAKIEYYENLIKAEESNNMLYYLDCLNELFANMEKQDVFYGLNNITMKLPENTVENIAVFNNIFNVDNVKNDDIVRQIGFNPYYVRLVEQQSTKNPDKTYYTYKIYGVSYCETVSESSAFIKQSDKLIMAEDYDKNHVKAFNRVITFTSSTNESLILEDKRLSGDIYKIIDGVNNPYTVTDEYFNEVDVFNNYYKMLDGNKKFEKPKDLNIKQYLQNQTENEK